jgi:hypothetical protein
MIDELERMQKEVLLRHLPGGTEENHKAHQSGSVSGRRFEPATSRIRRSVNHSTTTFDLRKTKLSHYRHECAKEERKYSSYSFLTSALDGGKWSPSHPSRAVPTQRAPDTHSIGGWVGLRAGLGTEARGKILCLCRGSNPGRPACSQTLY